MLDRFLNLFNRVPHAESSSRPGALAFDDVEGRLAPGKDMFDVYAVSAPAGTVTGAPKIESMKVITELEREGRGPYAGSVGYFSLSGDCYFAIAIRSLFANGSRAWAQAASGIVYDSDADYEHHEVENKGAAVRRAIERAGANTLPAPGLRTSGQDGTAPPHASRLPTDSGREAGATRRTGQHSGEAG